MSISKLRSGVPVVLVLALAVTACGEAKKDNTATASTPTAQATTLTGDVAAELGAKDGAVAEVVANPTDAPSAASATETTTPSEAKRRLVELLAEDSGQVIDTTTPPTVDYVTVYSDDQALQMEIPTSWSYLSWTNDSGGTSFAGATDGYTQYVAHGVRTDTVDESLTKTSNELSAQGCTPKAIRPYEDKNFVGKARAFTCGDGRARYLVVLDGKGSRSGYSGYLLTTVKDATGVAATEQAFNTLDLT